MTTGAEEGPVLYAEPGSSWWPVLWGPVFCAVGAGLEALTGPVHGLAWILVAVVLAGMTAAWVNARRKVCAVSVTPVYLHQGQDRLAVAKIARAADVDAPVSAKPLGGGWTVPRKTTEVPLELDDGTVVLAWARHPDGLIEVLQGLVAEKPR
ncbi:hypothetical protein [Actinokineospora sp. NBRC 105648]|uniref:hypothetical protein n=1 Tax=Actinokineospora sp. NBRC 105648 TaxID=3032206 RepID=UPI00249FEFAA|nr:hypothetical protein [Actinokineospora sp. NBRC 105648]GLZ38210.1 hypothetical protein Acsp05_18340 [Actinokineospora sp. NBRC 105648]